MENFVLRDGHSLSQFEMQSKLNPHMQCVAHDYSIGNTLFLVVEEIKDRCAARWKMHSLTCDVLVHAHDGKDCEQLWKFRLISNQCEAPLLLLHSDNDLLGCYNKRDAEARGMKQMPLDSSCASVDHSTIYRDGDDGGEVVQLLTGALKNTSSLVRDRYAHSVEELHSYERKFQHKEGSKTMSGKENINRLRKVLYNRQSDAESQDLMLALMRSTQHFAANGQAVILSHLEVKQDSGLSLQGAPKLHGNNGDVQKNSEEVFINPEKVSVPQKRFPKDLSGESAFIQRMGRVDQRIRHHSAKKSEATNPGQRDVRISSWSDLEDIDEGDDASLTSQRAHPPSEGIDDLAEEADVKSTTVVIDNGSGFLKAGFAGDDKPRVEFQSIVGTPKYPFVANQALQDVDTPSDEDEDDEQLMAVNKTEGKLRGVLEIHYPIVHGIIQNWTQMVKLWDHTFYEKLKLPRGNLSPYRVLMTEPPLNPKDNRKILTQYMFGRYKIRALYIGIQAILALYAAGETTGVVLDIGDGVTHVVPVFEGYALPHAVKRMDIAGSDLTKFMIRLLSEIPENKGQEFISSADYEIAREIKEKLGFVSQDYLLDVKKGEDEYMKQYEMPDGNNISVGSARFRTAEPLFQPHLLGFEQTGVHQLLFNSIHMCDVDIRKSLLQKIILSGGTTLFKGFKERLISEVQKLVPSTIRDQVHVHDDADRKNLVWFGGAIMGGLAKLDKMWFTKGEFDSLGANAIFNKAELHLNM